MIATEKKIEITERIAHLREKVLSTKPTVCTERARFYTEVYRENEEQPVIIKRALALQKTLEKMTIFIDEGELIVGNQSSSHRAAPIFPEYAVDWLPDEMDELDTPTFQRMNEESYSPVKREVSGQGKKGILRRAFSKDSLDYPTFLRAKPD